MVTATATPVTSQTPRPSASLVILNSRNEVLLVHRNPKARHFGGVHVFPGGNYDRNQDPSFAMTAIRETFEESGILLASSTLGSTNHVSAELLDEARHKIHSQQLNFRDFLQSQCMKPDVDSLLPFTEWITPVNALRRFHTHFFVAFLPEVSSFSSGVKEERLPKHDGGQEVISARFIRPIDALSEFEEGKITLMPPQAYLLRTLSEILHDHSNTEVQRERIQTLSKGLFGRMVLNPLRLGPPDADGKFVLTYEGDETRGGSKGRRHRVIVKAGQGGITSEVTLERNFDVFTEIEAKAFNLSSKL